MTIHTTPNALVPVAAAELLPAWHPAIVLALDIAKAADLARQEKAAATRRAYGSDFQIFRAWCNGRGVSALPAMAESVAAFLACEVDRG